MALKLTRALIGLALLLLGYLGLFTFAATFRRYPNHSTVAGESSDSAGNRGWQPRGAYHVHSTQSDGSGSPSEIARAAKEAGLQFVVMTDHNLVPLPRPAYQDGVLVISAVELSTRFGHVVALGTPRGLSEVERSSDPVGQVAKLGGWSFLAHPVQRMHPWTDGESATRATGMELYSADTLFREALHHPFTILGPAVGAYLSNPMHALMILVRPQPGPTARLLELSSDSPKVALCAQDAHGFPPYRLEFEAFSLYLPPHPELKGAWPADPAEAAQLVIADLARGSVYCGFDALSDAKGFAIEGLGEGSRRARVGDRLRVRLPASAPRDSIVKIWGAGRLEQDGATIDLDRPGPMQIEVWLSAPARLVGFEPKPWIVPSPILVQP